MGPGERKPTRKRNRKRKRRIVSDSSSSEEDSSLSSSGASVGPSKTMTVERPAKTATPEDTDTDESEESSSSDESDSDPGVEGVDTSLPSGRPRRTEPPPQRDSPSPQPAVDIPSFKPQNAPEGEQALREKFRKFWMASIAEGFKEDLEEIRKEPNLTPSRLALLIESLASGADVFSSSSTGGCVNEMEVVLDQLP